MKKILPAMLILILVLAGCGGQGDSDATTISTAPTEPSNQYISNSSIEQQTQGAVRQYGLDGKQYTVLSAIGDQLILGNGGEKSQLCILTGDIGVITAAAELPIDIGTGSWQPVYSGIVYYDAQSNEAVYLNQQLSETNRVLLPEGVQGNPAFSPNGNEIYYCIGQEIRVYDVEQGISWLIKSHSCASQTLLGCYFDGQMLVCRITDEAGNQNTVYLSAETGKTLRSDSNLLQLSTYENQYYCVRMDGIVEQRLFGKLEDTAAQQLNVWDGKTVSALELGGAVCYAASDDGMQLSFYDLSTGKQTASVNVPGIAEPTAFLADRWTGCLWMLTTIEDTQVLLRWNVKSSPVSNENVYISPAYTAQMPDTVGLEACADRAEDMGDTHGVVIRLWENAVKYTGGYSVQGEYQTQAINGCLDQLDATLGEFPEDFLYKSVSSRIRICLVRSVSRGNDAVQFWYDGDAFILLPVGADVRNTFMEAVSYVVDSHVLGNSPMYDYWDDLNPEGFVYGNEATYSESYLEGDKRAFLSEISMTSSTEERSEMFWQAMKADNAEVFQSETMQKKLRLLCQAIRDAWRWEKKTDRYPWEQYLNEPIAYKK